ncbi:hypothetical protein SLS58_009515 [Diplodia intermedia]|uniref:Nephrocystin 3-like N-terminal domain-containing protein n=1 Tax=Diplodia intermedia TaxID=856260 RepID=A0ABR3TCL3_9PEZI
MVSDRHKCFRLRGIPNGFGTVQIQEILALEFSHHGTVQVEIHSLACNPVREQEWVATLGFEDIPASLARQPDYFINIPGSRRQLHLDTHFEGFTPLHASLDDKCVFDVVAIGGLNGHAFGSFKQSGRGHMWLRDDLPLDFEQARVFTYGYDTSPEHDAFQNISDIAETFRKTLATLRRNARQTSLVFIAHSLGGIILKAALNAMVESQDDQDKRNISSLRALFLFGVPNQGMNIESLIAMNPDITNRRIIYALDSQNSATLRTISEKCSRNFKHMVTVNFYETLKSPTALRRKSSRTWRGGMRTWHRVHCLKPKKVHGSHLHYMPFHLAYDDIACLQSLWFPHQDDRQVQATDPTAGTCGWILRNPKFQEWHESRSNLLWILGPPGAGKSTLMKYVFGWKNTRRQDNEIVAAFFVHGRGKSEMQHSLLGLYRALLHQILQQFPKHLTALAQTYKGYEDSRGKHGVAWTWSEQELRRCFFDIITNETPRRPVTVLVDALDEIDSIRPDSLSSPVGGFIAALKEFTNGHRPDHAGAKLRILVSCRYYPVIYDNSGFSILVEKENSQDIGTLIESHQALDDNRGQYKSLKRIIAKRANGIFQWVAVVLNEVTRLHNKGMSLRTIQKAVETVPESLHDLYESLILDGDLHERKQALKLFTWLIFAARPLSLAELRDALAIDAKAEYASFGELSKSKDFRSLTAMEKAVNDLSHGLIQVQTYQCPDHYRFNILWCSRKEPRHNDPVYDGRWQTLQLMHQSVLDYLKKEGLCQLAASIGEAKFSAQWELSRSCIRYLLLGEIVEKPFAFEDAECTGEEFEKDIAIPLAFDFALTEYAHSFWLLHVMKTEEDDVDQRDLLRFPALKGRDGYLPDSCNLRSKQEESPFLVSENDDIFTTFTKYRTLTRQVDNLFRFWDGRGFGMGEQFRRALVQHPYRLTFVELLSLLGVQVAVLYMQELQQESIEWENTTVLLQYALLSRRKETIDWILENMGRHHLQHLLSSDADPSLGLPLTIAVAGGDERHVQWLLNAGADVDARSGDGLWLKPCTALGMAAQQGNTAIVNILLNASADPLKRTSVEGRHYDLGYGIPHLAAAAQGHEDVVELLLEQSYENGSIPQLASMSVGSERLTLLQLCHTEKVMKILFDHGVDPTNVATYGGETLLHTHHRCPTLIRLLLEHGVDPTKRMWNGFCLLDRDVGEFDETYNLMFNWTDSLLRTSPMLVILAYRADEKRRTFGFLRYDQTFRESTVEFFGKALDQSGISLKHDWNKQDLEGCTLLAVAVEQNMPEIVEMLLDSGEVDQNIADNKNVTPLEKAKRNKYHTVTELLQSYQESTPGKGSTEITSIPISRVITPVPSSTEGE